MKTLLILRHGKAEQYSEDGDKGRALTARGASDGEKIAKHFGAPDLIVASNAERAAQTARIAARMTGYTADIIWNSSIYEASLSTLTEIIRSLPPDANTVLIVGHNPGFEELAALLAVDAPRPLALKTSGLAAIGLPGEWSDGAIEGSGKLIALLSR